MNIAELNYKQSGIYAIHNTENGHHYIGSAVSIKKRTKDHISKLNNGIHENNHLQNAFNKYGEDAFLVQVVELVSDKTKLTEREQFYLDTTIPHYNILKHARSALGFKHSEEECARIGVMARARHAAMTPEEKQKQKSVFCMTGKVHSQETKKRMSEQRIGVKKGPQHAAACAAAWKKPEFSEKYAKVRAACVAAKVKRYIVTDPDGVEIEVQNLSEFCRQRGLAQAHMSSAARGVRRGYKDWLCRYAENPIPYNDSHKPRYEINGKMLTVTEIGLLLGLHKNTVQYHIKKGGVEKILRLLQAT